MTIPRFFALSAAENAEIPRDEGVNQPVLVSGKTAADEVHDVYVKLSDKMGGDAKLLVVETISNMLARDLFLNAPEAFIVNMGLRFDNAIPNHLRTRFAQSIQPTFGTKALPKHYKMIPRSPSLTGWEMQIIFEIFCFDALVDNLDRGGRQNNEKENCLIGNVDEIAIIDHEKCFGSSVYAVIGGISHQPWKPGSLKRYEPRGSHIFIDSLRKSRKALDYQVVANKWRMLDERKLEGYINCLPSEWHNSGMRCADAIVSHIRQVRDNIDECMKEVERVISLKP